MALSIKNGNLFTEAGFLCTKLDLFAVVIDNNPSAPQIMAYGSIDEMTLYLDRYTHDSVDYDVMIVPLPVDREIVDELNQCIECSSRVENFVSFLYALYERRPELAQQPVYPN